MVVVFDFAQMRYDFQIRGFAPYQCLQIHLHGFTLIGGDFARGQYEWCDRFYKIIFGILSQVIGYFANEISVLYWIFYFTAQ